VDGSGGGKLEGSVVTADTNFFKSDFSQLVIDLFFNTSIITPFLQADPAALVAGFTPQYGGAVPGFSFTSVNGLGGGTCDLCDFQFQADANQSFSVAAVPEPNTLALLGCALGVAGLMGGVGRRYRRV
ncbi:PEP-CTERM sorting domain-containing protein, partial [Aromatoleum evansii]|uniref:PEP-CTERM sorting domain-containing protein n=1 Tax=Aromatoleum evansii TaxID=59406 RepID=UPI00145CF48E|nr:hypothetical protein [Aromatoleum evansii]